MLMSSRGLGSTSVRVGYSKEEIKRRTLLKDWILCCSASGLKYSNEDHFRKVTIYYVFSILGFSNTKMK